MSLMLKNTGKNSITIRFGEGLNQALQILPEESKPLPINMSKSLMQSYLSLFKDLKVVDAKNDNGHEKNIQKDTGKNSSTGENSKNNKEEKEDPKISQEVDNIPSESQSVGEENENMSNKDKADNISENSPVDSFGTDKASDEESGEGSVPNEEVKYTAKDLKALSIDEIKEIAIGLGIDVEDPKTNSKKEIIAVILNKQGK